MSTVRVSIQSPDCLSGPVGSIEAASAELVRLASSGRRGLLLVVVGDEDWARHVAKRVGDYAAYFTHPDPEGPSYDN